MGAGGREGTGRREGFACKRWQSKSSQSTPNVQCLWRVGVGKAGAYRRPLGRNPSGTVQAPSSPRSCPLRWPRRSGERRQVAANGEIPRAKGSARACTHRECCLACRSLSPSRCWFSVDSKAHEGGGAGRGICLTRVQESYSYFLLPLVPDSLKISTRTHSFTHSLTHSFPPLSHTTHAHTYARTPNVSI